MRIRVSRVSRASRALASLLLASVALSTAPALADDSEPERLFREGRAAMLDGRFDEACPKIAESHRLDPRVGTLLNLAACHERQGKIASAWVEYQKVRIAAQAEGQADRARLAEQRIAVIEERVPWLRIAVAGDGAGVAVTLDGSELTAPALRTELPVDPGVHVVGAEAVGRPGFEERVELREGERRTVTVVLTPSLPTEEKPPASRIVVEPPKRAGMKGQWIFEPGVYVAFVRGIGGDQPAPTPEDAVLERSGSGERTNCLVESGCSYGAATAPGTASLGLNLFGGYGLSDYVQLGLRLLVGPMFSGGILVAFGPQVSFRPTSALTIGAFAAVGSATITGETVVIPPPGLVASRPVSEYEQRIGGGGAGLELALRVATLQHGEIVLNTTPFFLGGTKENLLALPFGIAYRFK